MRDRCREARPMPPIGAPAVAPPRREHMERLPDSLAIAFWVVSLLMIGSLVKVGMLNVLHAPRRICPGLRLLVYSKA